MLHQVRSVYLEHAPRQHLQSLIARCVLLCNSISMRRMGVDCDQALIEELDAISILCESIVTAVTRKIDEGTLTVREGRIVSLRPGTDDDDEDEGGE